MLAVRPGNTVADLGCGPGTDLERLASLAGPAGRVIGVDTSARMVTEAGRRASAMPTVRVLRGDLQALPLATRSVDRARTDRVLQHVREPLTALREVRRVLRPGGVAVFCEPDWNTLTVDTAHPAEERDYKDFLIADRVANPDMGRALPRLAHAAGLTVRAVRAHAAVVTDRATADSILGITRVTARAVAAGALTPDRAEAWLAGLHRPTFTAALTVFIVGAVAERPEGPDDISSSGGQDGSPDPGHGS